MSGIFQKMFEACGKVGNITNAHLYDDFISIDGVTYDGKAFSLSLHIKEEKNND